MSALRIGQRLFFSEYGAARAYLFSKLFLIMLGLDTLILMIGHAGRYGMTGFNVAHFEWLDRLQPMPSAGLYIGVLVLVGLLSFAMAFSGYGRRSMAALFLLYTFSWSMSMLDSYQHHYFVSLVLLCMVFFPTPSAVDVHPLPPAANKQGAERAARAERAGFIYAGEVVLVIVAYALVDSGSYVMTAFVLACAAIGLATFLYGQTARPAPRLCPGFGFPLLGATVAILYTYTAIAKIDPLWIAGDTIRVISDVEREFGGLAQYAMRFGISGDDFWSLFATVVIPQELFIAGCYMVSLVQDTSERRWPGVVCWLGFASAVVLHMGAETMGLEIGWFSYYMLVLAAVFLLPLSVVDRLATVITWPARAIERAMRDWDRAAEGEPALLPIALSVGGAVLLGGLGSLLGLPGALPACIIAGVVLVALSVERVLRKDPARVRRMSAAALLAAIGMWLAIALSPVRFDFYRYLGGDLSRRDQPAQALQAYIRAERYAPEGKSRAKKIRELQRQLDR